MKDLFSSNTMKPYVFEERDVRKIIDKPTPGVAVQASDAPKKSRLDMKELNKMTKKELETFAIHEFDIELDARQKKEDMIERLLNDPNIVED